MFQAVKRVADCCLWYFFQLPPVEDKYTGDRGDYAFNSKSWRQLKHLRSLIPCIFNLL